MVIVTRATGPPLGFTHLFKFLEVGQEAFNIVFSHFLLLVASRSMVALPLLQTHPAYGLLVILYAFGKALFFLCCFH